MMLLIDDFDMKREHAIINTKDLIWSYATNAKKFTFETWWPCEQNQSMGFCHAWSIDWLQGMKTNM